MKTFSLAGLLFVLAIGTTAATASAQATQGGDASVDAAAEAKRQFLLGRQAFEAKRYADAAQNFEAAAAYKPHPVTFYTAAVAWDLGGRSDRAADAFARAIDTSIQGSLKDDEAKKARDRLSALEGVLGTVTVAAPEGWKVQLDGNSEALAPARLHAKPGVRQLVYRAPGRAVEKKDLTLEAGQKVAVSLPEPVAQVAKEPEPKPVKGPVVAVDSRTEDSFVTIRKSAGLVIAGIGAASLGASAIMWGQAQGAKDVYDAKPTQEGFDHGESLQQWTNITLIAGGILLAGGVTLFVLPAGKSQAKTGAAQFNTASPKLAVAATPTGALLKGQF
jgi:hypothetical protein